MISIMDMPASQPPLHSGLHGHDTLNTDHPFTFDRMLSVPPSSESPLVPWPEQLSHKGNSGTAHHDVPSNWSLFSGAAFTAAIRCKTQKSGISAAPRAGT